MITAATISLLMLGSAGSNEVSETDQWQREFVVTSTPQLIVENVAGSVRIRGHQRNMIVVNATETRSARNQEMLERSRQLMFLEISDNDNEVALEVIGPHQNHRSSGRRNHCRGCQLKIEYEIAVPIGSTLDVSTVNDGVIQIDDVAGLLTVRHVNGAIEVHGAHECDEIRSVNGKIDISFAAAPTSDCEFNTVNGDLTVALPDQTDANLAFDLFNGTARSDFDVAPLSLPATVEQDNDGSRKRYRIRKSAGMQIGAGGVTLDFHSINGDVAIERQTQQRNPR